MQSVSCDLCGSTAATELMQPADYLLDRPQMHARLVRCTGCGLIYQSPRPTLEEIGEHYPPGYDSYGDYRAQARGGLLRLAYDYGMRKRCRYVTRRQPGGRLLDVGCAAGLFLVALREQGGWDVEGVELDGGTADYARRTYGLTVHTGTLEAAALPSAYFDAVTLWDVLEHLHEPTATLREVRRILRPGGTVVLRVPNVAALDARLFGEAWAGYDAPRHLYVYSPQTLRATLETAGFRVQAWDTAIGAWPVFALSTRFAMARANASPATRARVQQLLNHPATRVATAPLFSIPSLLRRGPLLVMTAQVARQ
jgi:2-polyprenyl-3-methyl-5-hydroxy-6-metoxy-1,4-benzoquinol methylase